MAITPKFDIDFENRLCERCGRSKDSFHFLRSRSVFFPKGYVNVCTECLGEELERNEYSWECMDRICQYVDIPFEPTKYEELREVNDAVDLLRAYDTIYLSKDYERIDWGSYNKAYEELKENDALADVVPILRDEERQKLIEKWGANYDDEALHYLENLYNGLLLTQNINGALQGDQAIKICKISYEIDNKIRAGEDFDKLLASYDKLVKTGEFTPKNVKNAGDFESMGELCRWLEKKGFVNQFYDGETRDVVDETIKNIQSWNQRLYTNESGIGDEINQRIQSLKTAAELENYYDLEQDTDYDQYENEGFEELFKEEEFEAKVGDGESDAG